MTLPDPTRTSPHAERIGTLAELALAVGVNLQPSQELIVNAPLEAQDLVQAIAQAAYQRGARLVTCLYDDPALLVQRLAHASEDSLDAAAHWLSGGIVQALKHDTARLFVVGPCPDLLAGLPPEKLLRVHSSMARAGAEEARYTAQSLVNWSTVPYATASWARAVFPDRSEATAVAALWEQLFAVMRCLDDDPAAAWQRHCRTLDERRAALQALDLDALRISGGGTELEIGLVPGHRWVGGSVTAANGIACVCNMPTEEVFTCPHRERVDGRITFTHPIMIGGTRIAGLAAEFRAGRLIALHADEGEALARTLLDSDEGASRLGEVGLVPADSPVGATGTLFLNPLLDENAASHVAFGQSYAACAGADGEGSNHSSLHIDCMFGSAQLDVTGRTRLGREVALMRGGRFLI